MNTKPSDSTPLMRVSSDVQDQLTESTGSWRRIVVAAAIFAVVIGTPIALFFSIYLDTKQDETQKSSLLRVSRMLAKYAARNGKLPPFKNGSKGKLYSWRLKLISFDDAIIEPHLKSVYREYNFKQAWDSDKNEQLTPQVRLFTSPNSHAGIAQILAVKGAGTMWQPSPNRQPYNTPILISYSASDVSWTEPRDVVMKSSKLFFESKTGELTEIELSGIMVLWGDESITAVREHPKYNDQDRKLLLSKLRNVFVQKPSKAKE
jgi:hypothetical protein